MDNKQQYPMLWPGWETVRLIGRGSFGAVYEIRRPLGQGWEHAAVKHIQIPPDEGEIDRLRSEGYDEQSITRRFAAYLQDFMEEYGLMARMKGCANIVYCDDVRHIRTDDGPGWDLYIKMELLTPLTKALDAVHPEEQATRVGRDLCRALAFFEKQKVLHRDIKPQNIFVSADGTYKLGDFGVARTLEGSASASMRTGTERYMSPEVYQSTHYDARADQYSLGLVLYWLLNERRLPFLPLPPQVPLRREEEQAQSRRLKGEPLPAPKNGSAALKRIVLRACAFDPMDRYASAEEMLRELEQLGPNWKRRMEPEDEPLPRMGQPTAEPTPDQTQSGYEKDAIPAAMEEEKNKTLGAGFGQQGGSAFSQEDPKTLGARPGQDRKEKTEENRAGGKPPQPGKEDKAKEKESPQPQSPRSRAKLFALLGVGAAALILLLVLLPKGGKKAPAPTPAATRTPVSMSTPTPTSTPTPEPTAEPTPEPTAEPTPEPTPVPAPDWEAQGYQKTRGQIYWKLESGTLYLVGEGEMRGPMTSAETWDGSTYIGYPWYALRDSINRIEIGEGITSISEDAFWNQTKAASVFLPKSLTKIEEGAFSCCRSLREITIPEGVTSIGKQAFYDCDELKTVTFPASLKTVPYGAFSFCDHLESIRVSEGTEAIGNQAFWGCGMLQTVYLPKSLTHVFAEAFRDCSGLAHVYYAGERADWQAVRIDRANEPLTEATIHYSAS